MFDNENQVEEVALKEDDLEADVQEGGDDLEATELDDEQGEDEGTATEEDKAEPALVVSFGDDEEDEAEATPVIRSMRQKLKDQKARIKELEQATVENKAVEAVQLGEKPTLESVDYDSDKFETALLEWNATKRDMDAEKTAKAEREEAAQSRYMDRLDTYQKAKVSLGAKDFDDAEEVVRESLNTAQQSIIVANAKRPEILIYALGKNPDMLKGLATEQDLASFAFKLGQMESGMKVTGMSKKPTPEKRLKGGGTPPMGSGSKKLEQLRTEAEKTGDYSKVTAYKKQMRSQ